MTEQTNPNLPESQHQRWLKYGANVALSIIIVIVLAIVVMVLAQKSDHRFDTTANRDFSLKPQTLNIIHDLKQPIKIVSLYTHPQGDAQTDADARERADAVADLLAEYKADSSKIDVEVIDPATSQAKVDDLYNEVTSKYGGEVKKYKTFLDEFTPKLDALRKKVADEAAASNAIPTENLANDENGQLVGSVVETIDQMPKDLDNTKDSIKRRLTLKHPDYKQATDTAQAAMTLTSQRAGAIADIAAKVKGDKKLPSEFVAYVVAAAPRFEEIKKEADELSKQIGELGSLKVDDLSQSLKDPDPIVVMGENDMRVLPYDQVWHRPARSQMLSSPDGQMKPVFAGEQEISTAILGLTSGKKPKVCIVRNGGAPLATPGFPPFQQGGPMSEVAERLRQYNFDVTEKDLSGTYAMQAQMQGGQAQPEPSDADIKDAIWVVLGMPAQQSPMGPAPQMAPKVLDHLKDGGSALILLTPGGEDFEPGLRDWGVDDHTNAVAVHSLIKTDQSQGDYLTEAQKYPFVFDITNYGDATLAKPLRSLKSLLAPLVPMRVVDATDCKVTPFIPLPQDPKSWGDMDLDSLQQGNFDVKFNPDRDLENTPANPLYAGATSEQKSGNRLVTIGSVSFMFDQLLDQADPELAKRRTFVSRFPANAELFCNSVFWLAHMEPMIAISPAAMDVSRIGSMSNGALNAWRVWLLVGLPGAVVLCGIMVYFARRD